jgi:hypothetical protein
VNSESKGKEEVSPNKKEQLGVSDEEVELVDKRLPNKVVSLRNCPHTPFRGELFTLT